MLSISTKSFFSHIKAGFDKFIIRTDTGKPNRFWEQKGTLKSMYKSLFF